MSAHGKGSGPGRRAVLRWAWRMFRREWRQQLLVLALLSVAVAAAVAGSSMAVNAASPGGDEMGDAGGRIRIDGGDPAKAQADVAAARQRFGAVEVIGHTPVAVPGSPEPLDLRAQDPHGAFGRPLLALRDGRYPATGSEVALTSGAAERLSSRIGQPVDLGGRTLTVVGRVENPSDLADEFALVPPDADAPADSLTLLIGSVERNAPPAAAPQAGGATSPSFRVEVVGNDKAAVVAFVLIVVTLAMALVALIAAAGFVVVAQRRQRQLGLLAALGATERHLRLVMLANGVIVGVAAALVGGALGILGWILAAPAVEGAAGHRIDRLALPWGLIGECLGLAVVAAAAAAWWPARAMARVPVMAALSRRPARPSPVHRSLAVAVGLVGLGVAAIVAADPNGDHVRPLVLISGLVAMIVGLVLVAPGAIRALRAPARRLPFAPRLALRDLVRYQARTAGALAAITLGLGIAVSIVVLAKLNEYRPDEGNLSNRELLVRVAGDREGGIDANLSPTDRARLDAGAGAVATAVGGGEVLALDVALNPTTAADNPVAEPVGVVLPIDHGFRGVDRPYVAAPALLAHLGVDSSSIEPATELLTSLPHPENLLLIDLSVRPDGGEAHTVLQRVDLSAYTSGPRSVITEHAMQDHGWVAARAGWLVESATPLTPAQVSAARQAAARAGLTVEARSAQDELAALRTGSTAVGALLALAIVAMAIGLLRGEAAADLRTLTATGATARTRRALTASTAGALAMLGVVLSIAGAYATVAAAYHADLDRLVPLPLAQLLLLAIGLPAVATAGGWLLAGREPQSFARQGPD